MAHQHHPYKRQAGAAAGVKVKILAPGFGEHSLDFGASVCSERCSFAERLSFGSAEYDELSSAFSNPEAVTTMFGKPVATGRREALWGIPSYTFSGRTITPSPMVTVVSQFIDFVSRKFGASENEVWVFGNKYETAKGIGAHSDDETNYVGPGMVATLSISPGLDRTLRIKPKTKGSQTTNRIDAPLTHGTCLFMMGRVSPGKKVDSFQENYTHGIPPLGKRALAKLKPGIKVDRISLTARFKATISK